MRPSPRHRLLLIAGAAWVAAWAVIALPPSAGVGVLVVALAGTLVALFDARRRTVAGLVAVGLAAIALVTASSLVHHGVRTPEPLVEAARESRVLELRLAVTGQIRDGRLPAILVEAVVEGRRTTSGTPLLLFTGRDGRGSGHGGMPAVAIGSVIRVNAVLESTEAGDDVAFLAFARGELEIVTGPPALLAVTHDLRAGLRETASDLPGPGSGLLPGLAIGDTSALDPGTERAMTESSLSHLTAVSGANCAVVVAAVVGLAAALGARTGVRVAFALVALTGFVVLVTPEPSVLRAAVMAAVALGAVALGRPSAGAPALALTVIVLLAIDPWLARSYGFALSVLATSGLLLLAMPLARVLGRVLPSFLATALSVPIAAQLACQPVILLLDPVLPVYGVVANLLAAPAAPVATILGLLSCLTLPLVPGLGAALAAVAWLPASWIAAVATFMAELPGARGPWTGGVAGVLLLAGFEVVLLLALLAAPRSRRRRIAALVCGAATAVYLVGLAATGIADRISRPPDWQYAACDIGQGDAVLVRSAGEVALVDTGPDPERLRTCLRDLGVDRIELLVLTHFDLDHIGGVDAVAGRVDRVLAGPPDGASAQRLLDDLAEGGAEIAPVSRGDAGRLGSLDWRVLWPPPGSIDPGNDASVVLHVTPAPVCEDGCLSAILLGDLGEEAQVRMLAAVPIPAVDVVKVSHHGSADQSAVLYERLDAVVGLIGVGVGNDYGHPADRILGVLDGIGTAAYRTDLDGLVLVAPGDATGSVEVWTRSGRPRDG